MRNVYACLFILALFGCSPEPPPTQDASTPAPATPTEEPVVIVYSPHGPDVLGDYEQRFEAAYPEVDVQWLDMGSQEVYTRIRAERNSPQADVWWGAPCTMFMQAAKEDLLEPYRPTWADAVDANCKDAQDRWYGTFRSPIGIVFNQRRLSNATAPQTWDELIAPKWHKRITIRKPLLSGTMRTFIGAMIQRAPSEDDGIAWLRKLHEATEAYMDNPQLLYDHMKRNEELVSVWLMPDIAMQRERNGYPLDCLVPPEAPVVIEGIALVKGAAHPQWARKFYEFVTSPESLAHQAEAYWKPPARTDLDPATLPAWLASLKVDALAIDWETFAENEKRWCGRWDKEVYGNQ